MIAVNLVDDYATLSSGSVFAADYPLDNVKKTERLSYAATQSLSNLSITLNFGHAIETGSFGIAIFGDFSAAAQFTAQAWSGINATGTKQFDSGLITIEHGVVGTNGLSSIAQPYWFCRFESSSGNLQSVVLQIIDPANPLGYHRLHRLIAGEVFSPNYPYRFGDSNMGYADDSSMEEDRRGNPHFIRRYKSRSFSFSCNYYTLGEVSAIQNFYRHAGKRRDIFLQSRSTQSGVDYLEHGMLGRFASDLQIKPVSFGNYAASFEVQEAIGGI